MDVVWVVEPERRSVIVYRAGTELTQLGEDDILRGDGLLEELEIPLTELFEAV